MLEAVTIGEATLYCGDCRDVLPTLPAVDCVITDPPYFKVKGDYWDNEWDKPAEFLAWMRGILGLLADRMKPNGSAYVFASPQMAGRVETVAWERLNVLGHIVWRKGSAGRTTTGWHQKAEKEALRGFLFETERVIFAEHYNSDNYARGEASYVAACDDARGLVFEPLRAYLAGEWERAGLTKKDADKATGTQMAGHWFTKVQWALPTLAHYERLREVANAKPGGPYLRREYEDLRREYEDLRRPFSLTERDQWSDVWDFEPVAPYPGKHPCEKPLPLLAHMLNASTKPGALVLDAFMGSGATGDACLQMGRRFIGIERDREHFESACRRLQQQQAQVRLFA
jgi:site-specific DNA-methyltransferase (adenine-specific)